MKAILKCTKAVLATLLASMPLSLGACATSFTGSAYVDDGRSGCERKCKGQGMELVGMVYMGEYSDACVCAAPGRSASSNQRLLASATSVTAGAAGVVMQMRRQEEQSRRSAN